MSREKLPGQVRKLSPTSQDSSAPRVAIPGSRAHNEDPSNVGASERFAEDAHKDERWEGDKMCRLRALNRSDGDSGATAHLYLGWFFLSGKGEGGVIGPEPVETSR